MSRVIDRLLAQGRPFLVLPSPGATSVRATAEVHGVEMAEVIRTEVLMAAGGPALIVLPVASSLDLRLARAALADPIARPATPAEVRSVAPDCEIDAVPPLSSSGSAPMYVDPSVVDLTQVVFPAGRRGVLVRMQREDLFGDDPYVVVPLTSDAGTPASSPIPPTRHALIAHDDLVPVHVAERRARGGHGADVA